MGEEFQRVAVRPVGVGELEEIAAPGGAGVVDQDVEATEAALDLLDQTRRRLGLAKIERQAVRLAPERLDFGRRRLEHRLVGAGEEYVAAFAGQRHRNAAADAAARSGHQRDLARKSKLH